MNIVLHKNQPPKRVHRKKELYKLLIARSDIGASLNAVKLLRKKVTSMGDDLYYPLFASIVICYARPFTNNKPYGCLPNRYQKYDDVIHQEAHKKLLAARHELIAHSDMGVRRAMITPPGVVFGIHNGKDWKSPKIGTQTSFYLFPVSYFNIVYDTSMILYNKLHKDIDALVHELYDGMDLPDKSFDIRIDNGL